jgi:hypothetical protein
MMLHHASFLCALLVGAGVAQLEEPFPFVVTVHEGVVVSVDAAHHSCDIHFLPTRSSLVPTYAAMMRPLEGGRQFMYAEEPDADTFFYVSCFRQLQGGQVEDRSKVLPELKQSDGGEQWSEVAVDRTDVVVGIEADHKITTEHSIITIVPVPGLRAPSHAQLWVRGQSPLVFTRGPREDKIVRPRPLLKRSSKRDSKRDSKRGPQRDVPARSALLSVTAANSRLGPEKQGMQLQEEEEPPGPVRPDSSAASKKGKRGRSRNTYISAVQPQAPKILLSRKSKGQSRQSGKQ